MLRIFSKVWEDFKEYIILVALLIVGLGLISVNESASVRKARAVAFGTFASVSSVFSDIFNITRVKAENERLRTVNAELMMQVNKLRHYGIANEELKGLVQLKDTTNFPLEAASIVSKSLSHSQGTLTINKGSNNGIVAGMPIINDQGLVGVVYSTSEDYAVARTLKNLDLKITVKNERSRADGILKWNGSDLVIIDVPKTVDIKPGDRIITSDVSSIVPVIVPVGIVKELSNVQTGVFNEVIVIPFVDFDKTENVFVIKTVQSKQKNNLELNFYNQKK